MITMSKLENQIAKNHIYFTENAHKLTQTRFTKLICSSGVLISILKPRVVSTCLLLHEALSSHLMPQSLKPQHAGSARSNRCTYK